jgi:hypothetical protein
LNIELINTSVVILVVHQDGIAVFKSKSQTPVAVHADIVARSATRSKCSSNSLEVRIPDPTKNRGSEN